MPGACGVSPIDVLGSPPASSRSTLKPLSARRAATVPPPAPEPTTMYSASSIDPLHGLEEPDQIALVVVAQSGFFGEEAGPEVVAFVDDKVGTFAHREHVVHDLAVGEDVVAALQLTFELLQKRRELLQVFLPFRSGKIRAEEVHAGQQTDRRSLRNRPYLLLSIAEKHRKEPLTDPQQAAQV